MKERNFFQGLQGKLLMFFLVMSLVPVITVSAISYQRSKASLRRWGRRCSTTPRTA